LYNFNPASIFMGDGGSLFLGFVLAAAGIKLRFPDNLDVITWMVPVLVLAVPIFDTTLVFISRLRRGLNPLTTPGKDHVSHRLVRRGLSPRRAVMVLYAVGLVAGALAFVVSRADFVMAYAILAAVVVVGIGMVVMLEKKGL
jgi:UDP-GlcNAc:undecaprenyl-phosphate GlcNAc-1-phosphate transferase